MIQIKRVYAKLDKTDGIRVLIDRLWPRGLSKEKAKIDLWLKDIAPSTALRKWFSHDPQKWSEFKIRYTRELSRNQQPVEQIRQFEKQKKVVTLVYGAKDEEHNDAVVLANYLQR